MADWSASENLLVSKYKEISKINIPIAKHKNFFGTHPATQRGVPLHTGNTNSLDFQSYSESKRSPILISDHNKSILDRKLI